MDFWMIAYKRGWATIELLRQMVITPENKYGEITPEQFKEITDQEYEA